MSDKMIHVVSLKEVYVVGNIPFIMQTPRVCSSLQDDIVPSASAVNGNRNKKHQFNRFPDLFFLEGSWKCERQQRASFNLVCTEKKLFFSQCLPIGISTFFYLSWIIVNVEAALALSFKNLSTSKITCMKKSHYSHVSFFNVQIISTNTCNFVEPNLITNIHTALFI